MNKNLEMAESEDSSASPDSTTRERLSFIHGEDVLLGQKDGKFYLGTVVEVDVDRESCLVKFLDNTSAWSSFKELTKLTSEPVITCVLCKKSETNKEDSIISCDKCGRGYHQFCHQPQIQIEETYPDSHWKCRKCDDCQSKDTRKSMVKPHIRKVCSGRDQPLPPPDNINKLPYDPLMLTWDSHHRVNAEQIYCYCGLNGEWYTKMLQCQRCKQWFHEKCIGCLSYPLYSGDRFYVFICSMCNFGKEYIRRLEIKWVDLVHLVLYNLTVYNAKKYYDLDEVIVPYINENWEELQLPASIRNETPQVRRDSILSILLNHRNRFKCGREIKKRTTIWGLRLRLPPPCPIINLPETGIIDDDILRECWGKNNRLQFISDGYELQYDESQSELSPNFESSLNTSTDTSFNTTNEEIPLKTDPKQSYASDSPLKLSNQALRDSSEQKKVVEDNVVAIREEETKEDKSTEANACRYSGGGFVKKSVPFPKLCVQKQRRRLMRLNSTRERLLHKQKKKRDKLTTDTTIITTSSGAVIANDVTNDDEGSGMREARYRKARKLLKNAIAKSKLRSPEVADLPPTPPTSVSSPPTPPATISSVSSELSVPSSVDLQQPSTTLADTSGDETTSSRGTLDLFIPPPKDFEGKNNPFLNLSELLGVPQPQIPQQPLPYTPITLPLPLTPVISQPPIVRPAKRQLSEKDIIIDRNGQVKRRRQTRRGRPPQQQTLNAKYSQTASKTAAILPARNNEVKNPEYVRNLRSSFASSSSSALGQQQIGNYVDYALNGRRLRQRLPSTDKLVVSPQESTNDSSALPQSAASSAPSSAQCSPVKQSAPGISMVDLKSSVNMYFGAANRIASGEKFKVRAKRSGPYGQTQYLIEWEGSST
ncbi:polycomb protein Pcl isoform X3 [Trichogramma pretiosum]|uniref:polycomb protein Pcl isoform X3 n=1 Tax=Trichogramma pretiosum TaxID=7493 RepID=UPI0006C9A959|nr:polycomb protein Pcl isoform X3 [Trichogramma pretiosum]